VQWVFADVELLGRPKRAFGIADGYRRGGGPCGNPRWRSNRAIIGYCAVEAFLQFGSMGYGASRPDVPIHFIEHLADSVYLRCRNYAY